jgi:beta-lactamase regulating signal transducer with metallopeptidase domain
MDAIIYLLQVSGCMAIFYLFYYLLLSRLTFFTLNRYYLLLTLVLSFIIPLLTLPIQQEYHYAQLIQPAVYIKTLQKYTLVAHASQVTVAPVINWLQVLKLIYVTVATLLFVKLLVTLFNFFINLEQRRTNRIGNIHILQGNKKLRNGSFLNYIFLNEDELSPGQMQQVIAHEMLHIRSHHSVDRIIMKISQIILWFNPFIYLYARAMEENHEFEVDRKIARSTDKKEYAGLLLHLSVAARGMLYNSFSKAPLKKRITMLFQQPSPKTNKLVYVLCVPILLLTCMAFATFKKDTDGRSMTGKLSKPNTDMSKMSVLEVRKEFKQLFASGKFDNGKFYSRVALADGFYDAICLRLNSAMRMTILPHNAKVACLINGVIHEEDEIARVTKSQIDAYRNAGVRTGQNRNTMIHEDPRLAKYGAYIEMARDFNSAVVNVKSNAATDALPWSMRDITINSDGTVLRNGMAKK